MTPATYALLPIKRGDTYAAYQIARITRASVGVPLASARLQIRTVNDQKIHEWSTALGTITLSGAATDTVTLAALDKVTTGKFPPGDYLYDLEVTTVAGETWTVMDGTVQIVADKTR